jgi:hypothetical protein
MKLVTLCAYYEPEIAASMYITTDVFNIISEYGWDGEL